MRNNHVRADASRHFFKPISMMMLIASVILMLGFVPVFAEGNVSQQSNWTAQQGNIDVSGSVKDTNGNPIPVATIMVKGTTIGTTTDFDGNYIIKNVPSDGILVYKTLGMTTQEIAINGRSVISVTLEYESIGMDEVVVVGYGTQRRVNMTGSVASVTMDDKITSRSLPSVSMALQGKVAGLAVSQNTGMAGRNDVQMLIRGMGTVNNADPLVVVDGMPGVDINRLNMNDIESVSVLKDASSAAIYGSRAANGVILITTKSGKGEEGTKINATASSTIGNPTHAWEIMPDYPRTLTIQQRDAAVQTRPQDFRYKNGTIDQWMALGMIDPMRYPNTDWYDVVLRDATIQRYNVSATGGGNNSSFFMSLGVLEEKGLLMNNDYSRYNGRINYNAKITSNINVGANFAGNWSEMLYAAGVGDFDGSIDANSMRHAIAGITPYDPETGRYGGVMAYGEDPMARNPYNDYTTRVSPHNRQEANTNVFMDWAPLKGLTARIDYALNYYNDFRYEAPIPSRAFNFQTGNFGSRAYVEDNAGIYNYSRTGHKSQLTGRLNYDFQINDNHRFNTMFAYSEEYWYDRYLMSGRLNRLHPSLTEIDASIVNPEGQTMRGNSSTEGLASYIGRINYIAHQRYLFEANLRYDGSSKFIEDYQWGFFPSASIGWLFSEEEFVQSLMGNWLYSGKVRASYGSLGNNSGVGRFQQRETLSNLPYIIDGSVVNGYVNSKMVNRDLSWEESTVMNVGLELAFFKGRLTTEVDVYDRLTTKMNRPSDLSIHLTGAYTPPPRRNIGSMRNRGIEGNFTWRDRRGDMGYTLNAVAAYNATVLEEWNEYLGRGITSDGSFVFINMPYNYVYAYEAIGIAQSWGDIYNATPQGAQPGDILYKDLNGDGKIDDNDMKSYPYLQSDRPTTNFALNSSIEWKGFDVALMLQGAAGRKTFWLTANNNPDVLNERAALSWDHWNKPWSWDNRDAEWARYGGWDNRRPSTFFLDNLAYLRIKNLQLGYNLPQSILLGLNSIRIYASADNLATFTKFRGLDPEKGGNINDGYPLMRSFTFGVNIGI